VRKDLVETGARRFPIRDDDRDGLARRGLGSLNEALKKGGLKFSDVNVVIWDFPRCWPRSEQGRRRHQQATVTRTIKQVRGPRQPRSIRASRPRSLFSTVHQAARHRRNHERYIRALRDYGDALRDGRSPGRARARSSRSSMNTPIKDPAVYRDDAVCRQRTATSTRRPAERL
jgi:hypothetical protein